MSTLDEQLDQMREKLAEIDAQAGAVDLTGGADAALAKLGKLDDQRRHVLAVIDALEARIADEAARVRAEAAAANAAAIAKLRPDYDKATGELATAARALQKALDAVTAVETDMRRYQWRGQTVAPAWLRPIPERVMAYWQTLHATAAGAEPEPTPEERAAAQAERVRAETAARYANLLKRHTELRGTDGPTARDMADKLDGQLARVRADYEHVGGNTNDLPRAPLPVGAAAIIRNAARALMPSNGD
jgi:chromosome segregation ATPase